MGTGLAITRRRTAETPLSLPAEAPRAAEATPTSEAPPPLDSTRRDPPALALPEAGAPRDPAAARSSDLSRASALYDVTRGWSEERSRYATTGLRAEMGVKRAVSKDADPSLRVEERADPGSADALEESAERVHAHRDELAGVADELRERYRIPGVRESGMDGFTAVSDGRRRSIGLLRRDDEGTPRLSVELAAERLAGSEGAERRADLERQLEALRAVDPDADLALVLAVAVRESGPGVISSSHGTVDSFHEGGLDHLARQLERGLIEIPEGFGPWRRGDEGAVTEGGRPAHGAMVPRDELILAYGLSVERAEGIFRDHVHEIFGDRADALLASMSTDARRAWVQITFGGPYGDHFREGRTSYGTHFGSITALEMLRAEMDAGRATGLDDVLTNERVGGYTRAERGRVSAAEAETYDRYFFAPERTPAAD